MAAASRRTQVRSAERSSIDRTTVTYLHGILVFPHKLTLDQVVATTDDIMSTFDMSVPH